MGGSELMTSPRITAIEVVSHGILRLSWNDRETLTVDISDSWVGKRGPAARLSDPGYFALAQIGEHGLSVDWPDDFGIGADTLYCDALSQAGRAFPTAAFNDWMKRHGLTLDGAAKALGLSRRMIAYYNIGAKPIPRTVGLACRGWEAEQHDRSRKRRTRVA
jgi:hypothetical protein